MLNAHFYPCLPTLPFVCSFLVLAEVQGGIFTAERAGCRLRVLARHSIACLAIDDARQACDYSPYLYYRFALSHIKDPFTGCEAGPLLQPSGSMGGVLREHWLPLP